MAAYQKAPCARYCGMNVLVHRPGSRVEGKQSELTVGGYPHKNMHEARDHEMVLEVRQMRAGPTRASISGVDRSRE